MWMKRILARSDQTTRSEGTDDCGLEIGGKVFPGQSSMFIDNKGDKNVNKKKHNNPKERPGEQEITKM